MGWIVTFWGAASAEFEALPADMRARFSSIAMLIEAHGLERMREPPTPRREIEIALKRAKEVT